MKARTKHDKQSAEKRGRRAETYAALFLQLKGYRIVQRRYRSPRGEIDLIAYRQKTLIAVEVKRRKSLSAAYESLHPAALARIQNALSDYVAQAPHAQHMSLRFDAIFVLPGFRIHHLKDAWRSY